MDYAEVEYMVKLRSSVKGHWPYRWVAWAMKEQVARRYPVVAERIQATPPDVEVYLTR
jgi:thymidylate synthase ThyX